MADRPLLPAMCGTKSFQRDMAAAPSAIMRLAPNATLAPLHHSTIYHGFRGCCSVRCRCRRWLGQGQPQQHQRQRRFPARQQAPSYLPGLQQGAGLFCRGDSLAFCGEAMRPRHASRIDTHLVESRLQGVSCLKSAAARNASRRGEALLVQAMAGEQRGGSSRQHHCRNSLHVLRPTNKPCCLESREMPSSIGSLWCGGGGGCTGKHRQATVLPAASPGPTQPAFAAHPLCRQARGAPEHVPQHWYHGSH